ncbi:MAG: hypothetical protein IJ488_02280 [Clostridia bacterium]|nr:hypothetical protein [Clostridia bacterium]
MKNRKLSKICLLTIALAMLITAIVGISVHAEDAPEAPEIVSKNVSYEGALHLYYAIPVTDAVTADNTVVKVYKTNPDTDASAELIGTYSGEEEYITMLGGNFIVVRTGGVPAKNIADYAYAQPVSGGVVGKAVRYSVAEYLYERLYVADNATDVQKKLYNSTLQYGIDAQAALAPAATPITDYNYVYAKDATLDAEGNVSGLYLDGATLTLTCTAEGILEGWKLKTLGDDGEFAASTQTSNTLTVNATTIISPDIFVRENKGETFDKAFKDSAYENVLLPDAADYKYSDFIYANKGTSAEHAQVMFGVVKDPTDATNRVLRLTKDSTTGSTYAPNLYVNAPSATTFDTFVFESDFYFDYYDKTGEWEKVMQVDLMNGSTIGASVLLSPLGGSDRTNIAVRVLGKNSDGTSISTGYETITGVTAECSWFNARIEYQILDASTSSTETRVYINGTLVKTVNYVNNETPQLNITRAHVSTGYGMFGEFYMDNVVCQKVVYADESRPVYDFSEDELPAGVTLTGDFKVNKGQLVASTTIGSVDTATFAPTETQEGDFNTVVWSADINATPTANQNGKFSEIAFYDENGNCFTFHIMFRNSVGAGMYFRSVTYGCEVASIMPPAGTEFNLRLEYYLADGVAKVDVYVNGVLSGTISDANQPNVATDGTKVEFKLREGDSQDVTLDNVRLYKINKDR